MTTYRALYQEAVAALRLADNPDAPFDARCLMEKAFGMDRSALALHGGEEPAKEEMDRFLALVRCRAAGEPLQYLLGEWPFLDESYQVGPGVLIPRPETELLAQTVLRLTAQLEKPVILDLCAGSGCIGLSIAKRRPDAQVYLLEKSPEAYAYLCQNGAHLALHNAHWGLGDVLEGFASSHLPAPHVIVSNPPYVASAEIASLQREVLREPHMALDGGEDGLLFYRALARQWLPFLKPGGFIAVECGESQAEKIEFLFLPQHIQTQILKDYRGIPRIVAGWKSFE